MLGEQIEALRGHSWPAHARKPVADLVEDMEDAREEWRRASTVRDADTYFAHYDRAYGSVDGPTTVTARKALGLAAAPPASGEGERGAFRNAGVTAAIAGRKCLRKALRASLSSHRVILWPLLAPPNLRLPRCCCLYNLMGAASDIR